LGTESGGAISSDKGSETTQKMRREKEKRFSGLVPIVCHGTYTKAGKDLHYGGREREGGESQTGKPIQSTRINVVVKGKSLGVRGVAWEWEIWEGGQY